MPMTAALAGLGRTLTECKGGDPLAPVTVVAPSGYAAVFVRRALGRLPGEGGRRGWANVDCTTVTALLRSLGAPALAARGLRLVSPAVDLEVIGEQARVSPGWLPEFRVSPVGADRAPAGLG